MFVEKNFTDGPTFQGNCCKIANQRVAMQQKSSDSKTFHDLSITSNYYYTCKYSYHILMYKKTPKDILV